MSPSRLDGLSESSLVHSSCVCRDRHRPKVFGIVDRGGRGVQLVGELLDAPGRTCAPASGELRGPVRTVVYWSQKRASDLGFYCPERSVRDPCYLPLPGAKCGNFGGSFEGRGRWPR